ncbi:hypothetical protein, partial [Amphritea sp.]|uniref:hypothetical protein n=1 Tax=Amphritea sp. TaxID=1872502 RepID=UPI003D0CB739
MFKLNERLSFESCGVLTSFPHFDFSRDLGASHFAFGSSFGSSLSCASPGLILVSLFVIQSGLAVCCFGHSRSLPWRSYSRGRVYWQIFLAVPLIFFSSYAIGLHLR